ncbi:MAG: hypothetical protein U0797_27875 [Gemmataceae bacterium]
MIHHRAELIGTVADHFGGDGRLDAVELVVDAGQRDGDRLLGRLEGGVDTLAGTTDDLGQQIDHGGKEQLTSVLPGGVGLEKGVELRGGQGAFPRGLDHDADWALGGARPTDSDRAHHSYAAA